MTTAPDEGASDRQAGQRWPPGPPGQGPLAGLRVLELSRILAGPFATMQLADLGADVIKVEAPGTGDETRRWGPPFDAAGISAYYLAVNRGKRSVQLDLAEPAHVAACRELAVAADVLVENFLPGRVAAFGLDLTDLRQQNTRLITASISGFGTGNAYSDRPGFDFIAQAMGGMMAVTGPAGGEPTRVGVASTDLATGMYVVQGVLAALYERERTGRGRHVEVALLDTQVAWLVNLASGWLNSGRSTGPYGNAHPNIAPYETLRTADGPLAVAVGTDRQFARLCGVLGLGRLAADPRFASNADRVQNRPALLVALEAQLVQRTRAQWLAELVPAGVPAGPVNTLPEVFADPVVRERMVRTVEGSVQVRSPIRLDGEPLPMRSAPPALGAHTDEVLG